MLRSLSHAALEHSRAVSSLQRSTTLLDLAYESEEDTDARTVSWLQVGTVELNQWHELHDLLF